MNKVTKVGDRFGKLILVEELPLVKRGNSGRMQREFMTLCDCGNKKIVKLELLNSGHTSSCGCIHKKNAIKHNISNTKEYNIYYMIKKRCYNTNSRSYPRYGGRGILMCDRWLESVENFIEDMGMCPEDKTSIDRKDNNLG
jgi:hypothetical protein